MTPAQPSRSPQAATPHPEPRGPRTVAPAGPQIDLLGFQRHVGNNAVGRWLADGGAGEGAAGGPAAGVRARTSALMPLRKSVGGQASPEPGIAKPSGPSRRLIVDDESEALEPGQERKSAFLETLQLRVCAVAEESLRDTIWSAAGCPYIDRWFKHYSRQSAAQVERALVKYAPEARGASSAADYIELLTGRVRRGMAEWKRSGEVSGLPPEFASGGMPGVTLQSLLGAGLRAAGQLLSTVASGVAGAAGRAARTLFSRRASAPGAAVDAGHIQRRLGEGRALDPGPRARMERAFGTSFGDVRLHTDAGATRLADELGAHAFTVGRDVAFGPGEYRPGTPAGDALLAHELAHVVQQRGASAGAADAASETPLEADADLAAAGAMGLLWGGIQRPGPTPVSTRRSGLALRRCGGSTKKVEKPKAPKLTAEQQRRKRFTSPELARRRASLASAATELRAVNKWVSEAESSQQAVSSFAVVDLDPKQLARVKAVIATMENVGRNATTAGLVPVRQKLDAAAKEIRDIRMAEEQYVALGRASDAAGEALTALASAGGAVDGYELSIEIEALIGRIDGMKGRDDWDRRELLQEITAVKSRISQIERDASKFPEAVETVLIVLRSFVALNTPGAPAPAADLVAKFSAIPVDRVGNSFRLVFDSTESLDFFVQFGDQLVRQMKVHEQMQAAGQPAASMIPSRGDADAYFRSLRSKPNDVVIAAYQDYARAYFFHRVVVTVEDMRVTDVAQLYARKPSITGMRPLVCSGYAQLGAHLLNLAGGAVRRFVNGVVATDEEIRQNRIAVGHSVAEVTRRGATLAVSNDDIESSVADGMRVLGTPTPPARLIQAPGSTQNASVDALMQQLQRRVRP